MSQLKTLNEEKQAIARELKEMADIEAENWNDELEARWQELNPAYDEKAKQIEDILTSQRQANERREHIERLADEARSTSPEVRSMSNAGRFELVEHIEERREEQRTLALAGWVRAGSRRPLEERHREACEQMGFDFRENAFDVQIRPYDNVRGHQAWSSGYGHVTGPFKDWQENRAGENLAGDPTVGGYTIPQGFQRELERALLDFGGMRRVARIWSTSGSNPIVWPSSNDTGNVARQVNEAVTNEPAVPVPFDQTTFTSWKYTSLIQASAELLEDSAFNLAAIFGSMLGERLGRGTAADYATGDGTTQPGGVVTESTLGTTAAANNAVTFDEIIDLIHSVDPAYRRFASFGMAFNDSTLQALRKLKDSQGRYLWEPSLQVGEPDRIFGVPYVIDQDLPSIGATNVSIVCGAMEKFVIRDHASVRFYRLEERYRELDLTGFSVFFRTDSHIVDGGTNPIKHLVHPV